MQTCNTCAYMVVRHTYSKPMKCCANRMLCGNTPIPLVAGGYGFCDNYTVFSAATAEEINDNFICEKQTDNAPEKGRK